VKALQPSLPGLWRLSIRRYLARDEQLELAAVWSATDTQVPAGLRISARASSLPEVTKTGSAIFSGESEGHQGLLEEIMAAEGVSSWVAIPLRQSGRVFGLLNISSIDAIEITPASRGFFERIGKAVETRAALILARATSSQSVPVQRNGCI